MVTCTLCLYQENLSYFSSSMCFHFHLLVPMFRKSLMGTIFAFDSVVVSEFYYSTPHLSCSKREVSTMSLRCSLESSFWGLKVTGDLWITFNLTLICIYAVLYLKAHNTENIFNIIHKHLTPLHSITSFVSIWNLYKYTEYDS